MMPITTNFAAVVGLLAIVGAAQAKSQSSPMTIMNGTCSDLVVAGEPLEGCDGKLMNSALDNGRTGFYFTAGSTVIIFSGIGDRQLKINDDNVVQPINGLIIVNSGTDHSDHAETFRAVGSCRYNNPNKGVSKIDCHADTERGVFSATFVSNGREPQEMGLGAPKSDTSSDRPGSKRCATTIQMHAFLSRAQFQCGYRYYSSEFLNGAKACARDMNEATTQKELSAGMKLFDTRERQRGHKRLCQEILRSFPNIVKR